MIEALLGLEKIGQSQLINRVKSVLKAQTPPSMRDEFHKIVVHPDDHSKAIPYGCHCI